LGGENGGKSPERTKSEGTNVQKKKRPPTGSDSRGFGPGVSSEWGVDEEKITESNGKKRGRAKLTGKKWRMTQKKRGGPELTLRGDYRRLQRVSIYRGKGAPMIRRKRPISDPMGVKVLPGGRWGEITGSKA